MKIKESLIWFITIQLMGNIAKSAKFVLKKLLINERYGITKQSLHAQFIIAYL